MIVQARDIVAVEYAGLAADAGCQFHAFWIDNRTGLAQIWTAPIFVEGKATRNGSAGLGDLQDVSQDVKLQILSSNYEPALGSITIGVQLKNLSKKAIAKPLKVRLVGISSALGSAIAANADNQVTQAGAGSDFSQLFKDDVLKPDAHTEVQTR